MFFRQQMERILKKASKTHKQRVEVRRIPPSLRQRAFLGIVGPEEPFLSYDARAGAGLAVQWWRRLRQTVRVLCLSRPQDFNRHLDTLTEHYDIPKVSWTK